MWQQTITLIWLRQILTDETRVKQIIMNGLTNAVKYSNAPANGAVCIVVGTCDDLGRPYSPRGHPGAAASNAAVGTGTMPATMSTGLPTAGSKVSEPAQKWLCIDVLDQGQGLRGVEESVLFVDFLAPITPTFVGAAPGTVAAAAHHIHVGSSGVGLPVCAKCVEKAGAHTNQ